MLKTILGGEKGRPQKATLSMIFYKGHKQAKLNNMLSKETYIYGIYC